MYTLIKKDPKTNARRGVLTTAHGSIETPFFMPVGTNGGVKSLSFENIRAIEAQIVLSNTYHLYLRPGMDIMHKAGGLHGFMNWDRPILTDSGGYQVFSLTKLRKLTDEGVEFQSHLDGSKHFLTPEKVMDIEQIIGSDMIMPLDVCAPYPCGREEAELSVERTTAWLKRSKMHFLNNRKEGVKQYLFGIIQGATYKDLWERSAREILDLDLDAYAIGGVSVGEPVKDMFEALGWVIPHLPQEKPRYFMGIGLPDQIVKAVGEGIDMFDTCIPTRYGRHGTAFTNHGRVNLKNAACADDFGPIDAQSDNIVCRNYSRAYIRHMLKQNEILGMQLVSYHNVWFYVNLMKRIRAAIEEDRYDTFQKDFLKEYGSELAI